VFNSIKAWWANAQRATEQKGALAAEAAQRRSVAHVNRLRTLTDDELITDAPNRTSLSRADHEMEMQRRLKDAIEANTREGAAGRRAANRIGWILVALTLVLVALTVVLIMNG
jgi:hypothetical protein